MASGWVCGRCAAVNDEAVVACQTCGLIRGGEASTGQASQPAPSPDPWASGAATGPAGATPVPPAGTPPGAPTVPGGWSAAPPAAPAPAAPSWGAAPGPAPDASGTGFAAPPAMPGSAAPGGWPGATSTLQPASAQKQVAKGLLSSMGARIAVILVIVAIGAVVAFVTNAGRNSNGEIDKTGDLKPADLRVGDCFDLQGDSTSFDPSTTIDTTTAMNCSQTHHYEVFYTGILSDSGSYPTDAELNAFTDANCTPAFESYVGASIDTSQYTYYFFYPDSASWESGDRGLQCSLADPNLAPLTGTAKGSNK